MGNLFNTLDISYKSTLLMREGGNEEVFNALFLEEWESIPAEWLVFNENEMMSFSFIRLDEGDDPPVWYWEEGMGDGIESPEKQDITFSEWLHDLVQRHAQLGQAAG